jgi:predicted nucleic acid-binding protein
VGSYFLDSSALVKRDVTEAGSAWVLTLTAPAAGNDIYVAGVTGAEVVSALVRHVPPIPQPSLAQALAQFRQDFTLFHHVDITAGLILEAMTLAEKYRLRGYDAIQLAAAKGLHAVRLAANLPPLTLASADLPLNVAAASEGLTVDNPNSHP